MLRSALAVGWILVCGCGTPPPTIDDAGVADAGFSIAPPTLPAAPAAPQLAPCPTGWRVRSVAETSVCEPFVEGVSLECSFGQALVPGVGCEPVGDACPADEWALHLPSDRTILYVRPGAAAGGLGTRESPLGTLTEAVAMASAGSVIALGKGEVEEVTLPSDVWLVGACASESRLRARSASDDAGVITVAGSDVSIQNVSVTGDRPGIVVNPLASVDLDGVAIDAARYVGLRAGSGARVSARSLVVRGTRVRASTLDYGVGILVDGGSLSLERTWIDSNIETGLWIPRGSATLRSTAITRTSADRSGRWGHGLEAGGGASVSADEIVILESVGGGVVTMDAGTSLVLRRSVVRDTVRQPGDLRFGRGISVESGARATLEQVLVERSDEGGLFAHGASSELIASHVVVLDTDGAAGDVIDGFGLGLEEGASAQIDHAVFANNQTAGISMRPGTTLSLTDAVVRDTRSRAFDGAYGHGIHVESNATLERVLLERNHQVGLLVVDVAVTDCRISDLTVRDTLSQSSDQFYGRGVYVGDGAHATIARVLVERSRESGIGASSPDTYLELTDATVRDTASDEASGHYGLGLVAQDGASVVLTRAELSDNREVSVTSRGSGTTIRMTDVVVRDTRERECVTSTCPSAGTGIGIGAYTGGYLEATRFEVRSSALAGVQLAEDGTMDLHTGVVSANPIGANVQTASFDTARLNDRVLFFGNERNLDAAALGIPEPLVPF